MLLDMLFNLFAILIASYLLLRLFVDMSKFEWKFIQMLNRVLGFCKHNGGYSYVVEHYILEEDTAPKAVYKIKCGLCGKCMGKYMVETESIIDTNISTVQGEQWLDMTVEEFDIIKHKGEKV